MVVQLAEVVATTWPTSPTATVQTIAKAFLFDPYILKTEKPYSTVLVNTELRNGP